jgi:hypothetical protein
MENIIDLIDLYKKQKSFPEKYTLFIEQPTLVHELICCAGSNLPYPYPAYSSWWVFHLAKNRPASVSLYSDEILKIFLSHEHPSVMRNMSATLLAIPSFSSFYEGNVFDRLLFVFLNHEFKVATQVNAFYLLNRFISEFPELRDEVASAVEIIKSQPFSPAMRVALRGFKC